MKYINFDVLHSIDVKGYREKKPFPFTDVDGVLYEDAYQRLVQTAPDVSLFENQFGIERKSGQKFHDKFYLLYTEDVPLSTPWKEFVDELHSAPYRAFLESMFHMKPDSYSLTLSWHYMPRGTCITPHCDTKRKIGSQLFYLNTTDTWDPAWGGQTLALDDRGEKNPDTGPSISEFYNVYKSKGVDNNSFIFTRTNHSWHAVEELKCPENTFRKMFSVVANRKPTRLDRMRSQYRRFLSLISRVAPKTSAMD